MCAGKVAQKDKSMKRIVLSAVLAFGVSSKASQPSGFDLFTIPQMKEEKIAAFKNSLSAQVRIVQATKLLTYGALAYGSFEFLRRTFFAQDSSRVTQAAHRYLATQVKTLEDNTFSIATRVSILEGRNLGVGPQDWMSWCIGRAKSMWRSTSNSVPDVFKSIASMYIYSQVANTMFSRLPSVDSYLGFNPTMNWCMFNGSTFVEAIGDFLNWYQAFQAEPGKYFDPQNPEAPLKNLNMKSFALCSHNFVSSMEQLLGYMTYVTSVLDTKDPNYPLLKARSEVCMETISLEATELIEMIRAFLKEEQKGYDILDGMLRYWQVKMLKIVGQFENFEPVAVAAGFKEREGRGQFNVIKKFIVPHIDSSKPEPLHQVGPLEEATSDILSSAQAFAS
jgi:hypothetical protein